MRLQAAEARFGKCVRVGLVFVAMNTDTKRLGVTRLTTLLVTLLLAALPAQQRVSGMSQDSEVQ